MADVTDFVRSTDAGWGKSYLICLGLLVTLKYLRHSNLSILSVHDEDYSRNALCPQKYLRFFLSLLSHVTQYRPVSSCITDAKIIARTSYTRKGMSLLTFCFCFSMVLSF